MSRRTSSRQRLSRIGASAIALAVAASLVSPEVAGAQTSPEWSAPKEKSVSGVNARAEAPGPDPAEEKALTGTPAVRWPAPAAGEVSLAATLRAADTTALTKVGDLPVRVGVAPATRTGDQTLAAAAPDRVRVEVLDKRLDGPVLRVVTPAGTARAAAQRPLSVEVDYSSYRDAYGGDWATRLRLAALPECALSTPERDECQPRQLPTRNDGSGTLTAALTPGSADQAGTGLFAVTAAASSGAGDFQASSLSPGATWTAGGSSGDFTWEYPMPTPPAIGGPEPELELSYSSGSVDARTSATNNQPSWVGEGFDFTPGGYIERRYASCSTDMTGGNNTKKTGDLCWRTDNASMSLNGSAVELVRDDATGKWRPRNDDGSCIERLSGRDNGDGGDKDDNKGEYWKITTRDGTQYFFGLHKLPGWTTGKAVTNSVWTVPVFGNQTGEPCRQSTFDASWCQQAWRWNLDYVVDAHGNTMSFFYRTETNNYARNMTATKVSTYVRDGYLERIDYGQRDGAVYTTPPVGQVAFTVEDRCIPGTSCVTSQPANWPDTPLDQACTSTTSCTNKYTPTFWTQKRLARITTKVWNGTAPKDVDSWTFTHSFPAPGDGTRAGMWLASIKRTGLVGGTASLPEVNFDGIQLANRVDGIDGIPPMKWWRIKAIRSETGGELAVTYLPTECSAPGNLPAEDNNTKRCHPLKWTPDSLDDLAAERHDWFHKYVVSQVTEKDLATGQAPKVTQLEYTGKPAWRHDDEDGLVPTERKTWSQWRGYDRVQVRTGTPGGVQSQQEVLYFQGMDDDLTAAGGHKDVKVVDSTGTAWEDTNELAGAERERVTYDRPGGTVTNRSITDPWISAPTATSTRSWGTTKAYRVAEARVRELEVLGSGSQRQTGADNELDAEGRLVRTVDHNDLADPDDDTCTRYSYARNDAANLVDLPYLTETVAVACDKQPDLPTDLIASERLYYDNNDTLGAAPVRGDVTRKEEFNGWVNGVATYQTVERSVYDDYGRQVETYDVFNKKSTVSYSSSVGGPVTKVVSTNPLGQSSTLEIEPAWGEELVAVDTNGKRSEWAYDPLGRVTKTWAPGRDRSQSPTTEHSYLIRTDGANVVTNRTLQPDGGYVTDYDLFDGQMRERQSQEPAPGGGRVVTDTIHDGRGLVVKDNGPYYNDAPPGTDVLIPDEAQLPAQTITEYDGLDRPTAEIFKVEGVEKWRTTHSYVGDRHDIDPPQGETPTSQIVDNEGRLIELRQYQGDSPTGEYDRTTYTYTKFGQLETVTDPAGNVWRHEYDLLGREIRTTDPDRGVTEMTYNDADQVVSRKDGRGTTLFYDYDALGRATAVHEGAPDGPKRAEWRYDVLADGTPAPGLPTASIRYVDGNAYRTDILGYDKGNQPTGMSITIPAAEGKLAGTYKFTSGYGADGDLVSATMPAVGGLAEETLTYGYNSLGLPSTLTGKSTYVTDTSYTPYAEPQQMTLSAGGKWVKRSLEYEIGTRRVIRSVTERETAGRRLSNVSYDYDQAGNVTRVANQPGADTGEATDVQCFGYDYLRRMTGAWTPGDGNCSAAPSAGTLGGPAPYWHAWTYDKVGNRRSQTTTAPDGKSTTSTYEYPEPGKARPHAVNKVTTTGPSGTRVDEYGYDEAGNTTTRKLASGVNQTLEWDAEGALAKVTDNGKVTSYLYDADGDRLLRRDATGTTLYLGATEVLLTPTGEIQPTRYYYLHDELVAVRGPDGALDWISSDLAGTGELAIDADTQEFQRRRITPFGEERGLKSAAWPGNKGFVGGTVDSSTGLTQLGERAYDPSTGRFISPDPVIDFAEPQQTNAYAYANNSPVTFSDPDGQFWGIVIRFVAKKVVVPVVKKYAVPVLKRVGHWIWSPMRGFFGKVFSFIKKMIFHYVKVFITKTVKKFVVKVIKVAKKVLVKLKKSKFVKAVRKAVKKAVDKVKSVGKKIKKIIKRIVKRERKQRKKKEHEESKPTPRLYAIGKREEPPSINPNRSGDYDTDGNGNVLPQRPPDPKGKSTFDSEDHLTDRVGGQMWMLPEGTKLPEGLDWYNDNDPPGHHTIYPTRKMSIQEFKSKIEGLPWVYQKKVKKKSN